MREIKFRAWNKALKKMSYKVNLYALGKDGYIDRAQLDNENCMRTIGLDCEVMESTGIFDKNKKVIYDGDVLLDTLTTVRLCVRFGHNRSGAYTGWYVEYLNIDRDNFGTINGDYNTSTNSQLEVIGNIYESPELLK